MIKQALMVTVLAMGAAANAETTPNDEESRLLSTLTEAMRPRLASQRYKLTDGDSRLLKRAAHLPEMSYFPVDHNAINAAVTAAIRDEPRSDFQPLLRAALRSITGSVGHGAKLYDAAAPSPPKVPLPRDPAADEHGDLHVVFLHSFGTASFDDEPRCRNLQPLFHAPPNTRATVVDLRGNGGTEIVLLQCAMGILIKASTPMFEVALKGSEPEIFEAPALADTVPADRPVVVFVDSKTDSGALLFAAVLGDLGRARIVGDPPQADAIMSSVLNLVIFTDGLQVSMPVGELRRAKGRKLTDGVAVDVAVDSSAPMDTWLAAARSALQRH